MSQKLKRGAATPVRKAAVRQGTARKVQAARATTGSMLDRTMAYVPLSAEQLHKVFLVVILGSAAALAWLVAVLAGVPAMAAHRVAALATGAGFEVRKVEVRGTRHLNELKVYERVLAQRDQAMTEVDLAAVRANLLQLSWVDDARVSRQLPDTLVVDIVERKPHAVLKRDDQLYLIDAAGHVLDPIGPNRVRGRMILSGEGVDGEVGALDRLLDMAPALRPQVAAAEWVGARRWNITFRTGQILFLPEGDEAAAGALMSFARLDGTNRLLGGKVAAFDMRNPDRIYMRIPGRADDAAKAAAEAAAARAKAKLAAAKASGAKPAAKEAH